MKILSKKNILISILILIIISISIYFYLPNEEYKTISYLKFNELIDQNEVEKIIINDSPHIKGNLKNGILFKTDNPKTETFKRNMLMNGITVIEGEENPSIGEIFIASIIIISLVIMVIVFNRNSKSTQKEIIKMSQVEENNKDSNVTFDDVAGNEEAKESLKELVDFLKNPNKYEKYGARIPRGVMLYGPPGTGKTLLAKALAGEADVSYKALSGSDFVQVYAGLGASRIRNLFKSARKEGKCVIFIDEIDALGKKRRSIGTSSDESDRTLNALLTEMSGFDDNEGIIVIAATNRIDTIDEALLRPGRFDRQIEVGLPDVNARYKILDYHSRNKPISNNVNLKKVAYETVYFSGAELENLMNESAMIAARKNDYKINDNHIDKAFYQVIAGDEKKDRSAISQKEKEITAYHEAGHGLITKLIAPENKVTKITIIPSTKGAGGFSMNIPPDKMYQSKKDIIKNIKIALAGRASEELIFGENNITTGASNDIKRVTDMVISMLTVYGMDEDMGMLNYHSITNNQDVVNNEIVNKSKKLVKDYYDETINILKKNNNKLNKIAKYLLDNETINEKELNKIVKAK